MTPPLCNTTRTLKKTNEGIGDDAKRDRPIFWADSQVDVDGQPYRAGSPFHPTLEAYWDAMARPASVFTTPPSRIVPEFNHCENLGGVYKLQGKKLVAGEMDHGFDIARCRVENKG